MSDHYCCKRCGQEFDKCTCASLRKTTPKRYEETFDATMFPGARVVEVRNNSDTLETVVVLAYSAQLQQAQPLHVALSRRLATLDASVRTAAREAQVRVLDMVKRSPRSDYCETSRVLDDLRARIDSGEDL